MPGTYSQLLLHVVFSTKGRAPWLNAKVAERLYPYIGGIVRAEKGVLYDIGGVEDHVHMYLRRRPDGSVSDLMRTVKARSSKWVHDTFAALRAFSWQEGYSVFSVSKSQEEAVKKYIAGQTEHHKKEDFKSELRRILRAHGVAFDEKYLFDRAARSRASPTPPGQKRNDTPSSTGFAALHPWLHSCAPMGRRYKPTARNRNAN